jgi:hypothetical protein
LVLLTQELGAIAAYLGTAEAILPADLHWREVLQSRRADLLSQLVSPQKRGDAKAQRELTRSLQQLKQEYVDAYLALHGKARLGANEDSKKKRLLQDIRLGRLAKLAGIELLPRAQLAELQNRLAALKPCYSLTKEDLEPTPVCPHCQFRPVAEFSGDDASAAQSLATVDAGLDRMQDEWTRTLIENLSDPTVKRSLEALSAAQRKIVDGFTSKNELPATIENEFVMVLQQVFQGLEKVIVTTADIRKALTDGGVPCPVADMKARFDRHLDEVTRGKDPARIRIVVE